MGFTDEIEPLFEDIVEATLEHPMVAGLGDGTLDEEPFKQWVRQDYYYLIEYNRVFALGAAKAPNLERMGTFATLLEETLHTEMDLHRAYAEEFGISEAELEATEPTPTTRGYTDFLVRTASHGTFGDLVAALLPCMWGFNEVGLRLDEQGRPEDDRYAEWIATYSSEEFTELTEWCRELIDDVAADAPPGTRDRYRERFHTSLRYEYLFWDAAWQRESWPV